MAPSGAPTRAERPGDCPGQHAADAVIGTGYYGRMQVPEETIESLRAAGVEVRIAKTSEAVAEFNLLQRDCARIVAALHLTC